MKGRAAAWAEGRAGVLSCGGSGCSLLTGSRRLWQCSLRYWVTHTRGQVTKHTGRGRGAHQQEAVNTHISVGSGSLISMMTWIYFANSLHFFATPQGGKLKKNKPSHDLYAYCIDSICQFRHSKTATRLVIGLFMYFFSQKQVLRVSHCC